MRYYRSNEINKQIDFSNLTVDELRIYKNYIIGIIQENKRIKRKIDEEIKRRL